MIKIYYANTDFLYADTVFEQLLGKVNVQRRSKILRCKNKEDKCRALAAGLLLRYAVEQAGLDYETAIFAEEENGKPYLQGWDDFAFSISHSGNAAVCAVCYPSTQEAVLNSGGNFAVKSYAHIPVCLGVDIESVERIMRICTDCAKRNRILKKIAASSELRWFDDLPESMKAEGFLRIWTGKESYGKRNGKGICQELWKIDVLGEDDFYFLQVNEQYYLTVCMENIRKRKCKLISINIAKEYLK